MTESLAVYYDASLAEAREMMAIEPLAELERVIAERPALSIGFTEALVANPDVAVIAEHKRKSPSEGEIVSPDHDVQTTAQAYEAGGATAMSILTQGKHFGGSLEDIYDASQVVDMPIIRKDFIRDPYQLYQAKAYGAKAALLIVDGLDDKQLRELQREAANIDLDCLVEVHDEQELNRALETEPKLLGINNRNLSTLHTDLATFRDLSELVPAGIPLVAESGYRVTEPSHIAELRRLGATAVLIGTDLMRADKPAEALSNWLAQ